MFQLVAFLLIGVGTYGKTSNELTSLPIIGGIVASGVFLLFVAVAGLIGAIRHHQILLFFYMVILFAIFVIQFSVACACLAVGPEDELKVARTVGWILTVLIRKKEVLFFRIAGLGFREKRVQV